MNAVCVESRALDSNGLGAATRSTQCQSPAPTRSRNTNLRKVILGSAATGAHVRAPQPVPRAMPKL